MVFQDPMTSFNPVYRIGRQLTEAMPAHRPEVSRAEARARAIELLGSVGLPSPERQVDRYPYELSGGMRQRAMIAMALMLEPEILIADEPTTALDVTIQAQILDLLRRLNRERGLATILITHDFGVVAEMADRVLVMHEGRIVERGGLDEVFYSPRDPYTRKLLGAVVRLDQAPPLRPSRGEAPLLEVSGLVKHFPVKRGLLVEREVDRVRAVDGVSFSVARGETLGLVGESGSGKSTLSRTILQLLEPSSGSVRFDGREIAGLSRRQMRPLRAQMQMVFQDPYASLNPRKRIGQIVGEPLRIQGVLSGRELRARVHGLLERVGLSAAHYQRFPHEFSGGQRQRVGIARALALRAEAGDRRRAGLGARRLDPRPDPRPAGRAAGRVRPHLRLRRPRHRRRPPRLRPDRGDARRQDRRAGAGRPGLRASVGPLHEDAAGGGSGARPARGAGASGIIRSVTLPLAPPLKPQLALTRKELPRGEQWAYEQKLDGFRAIVFVDGGTPTSSRAGPRT